MAIGKAANARNAMIVELCILRERDINGEPRKQEIRAWLFTS